VLSDRALTDAINLKAGKRQEEIKELVAQNERLKQLYGSSGEDVGGGL